MLSDSFINTTQCVVSVTYDQHNTELFEAEIAIEVSKMPHTCIAHDCKKRLDPSVKLGFSRFPRIGIHEG